MYTMISPVPALNQAVRTTAGGKRTQHQEEATKVTGKAGKRQPGRLVTSPLAPFTWFSLPYSPTGLARPGLSLSFRGVRPRQQRHLAGRAVTIVRPTRGEAGCPGSGTAR
jgi:hypothetical protein